NIFGVPAAIAGAGNPLAAVGTGLNLGLIHGDLTIPGTNIVVPNLQLLARALEGDSSANVLSTPTVLTLDNEEARIIVGQNVPFITGSYTPTAGSATNPFQTIERKDIGLTLRVTPTVSEAGAVKLKVYQEVSSVTADKTLVQSADIITNKRSLESTVLVDDGAVAVLAGLIQDDQSAAVDKVPLLGDIPYLGSLFKFQTRNHRRTNLMIFLRPVVLKDEKATAGITQDRYDYIRNLQNATQVPAVPLVPDPGTQVLPPLPNSPATPLGR
ncbi:MAG TPA: type II secretion system protein GspD, partial [Usitatibacter sp.]|nr:type II secretion system protein GspD [Usitatibacter sp.]